MDQEVIYALEIMGKGMAAIFVVIVVLMLIIVALSKITNMKFLNKNNED